MQTKRVLVFSLAFVLFFILLIVPVLVRGAEAEDRPVERSDLIIVDRRIERSDLIIVAVFDEPKLSGEYRVQAGGTIHYPLLGDVEVAGKTPTEVANDLNKKLGKDYLVNPDVTVLVKQYRPRTVTVMGKVMKPGPVLLLEEERMDIIQALAQAGGFQPNANQSKIAFSRNGKTVVYKFKELIKITEESKKIWLEPGDVIDVKESTF